MAYGEDRADVYANLIRDHEEDIIKRMDIDTILEEFPYKQYISESEFRSLTTETNSSNKSRLFVNIVLNKKKERVLEAFLQLFKQGNPEDVLWLYLRDRIARFDGKKEKVCAVHQLITFILHLVTMFLKKSPGCIFEDYIFIMPSLC